MPGRLAIARAGEDHVLHVDAAQGTADCSPSTQEIASEMFDLPQPLGPTMAAMPSP